MENLERNIEKNNSKEIKEFAFELETKIEQGQEEIVNGAEKKKQNLSGIVPKKDKISKTGTISPVLSKKMQYFLEVAEEKGLSAAIKEVEKEKDPLLLDSFHDALAKEKLFEELLNKKKA